MPEKKHSEWRVAERRPRCEIGHLFGGTSCTQPGETSLKGLFLCKPHALEVKLEEQIACWSGILFHVDLWSREADRRGRGKVVRLLEVQRAEAALAVERACARLDRARSNGSRVPEENRYPATARFLRAKGARLRSPGLRRR